MLNFILAAGNFQGDMVPTPASPRDVNGVPAAVLQKGNGLYSPSGGFRLQLQLDGNAVVECVQDATLPRGWKTGQALDPNDTNTVQWIKPPLWNSGTNDRGVLELAMQSDGNLVIYTGGGAIPVSNTFGNPGAFLRMQDDGNLVVYSADGVALWTTSTNARAAGA